MPGEESLPQLCGPGAQRGEGDGAPVPEVSAGRFKMGLPIDYRVQRITW